MGFLHRRFQFPLGDILDLLVNGEDNVFAGIGLPLDLIEVLPAGIHLDQHASGLAAQLFVVFTLDATEAFVVHPDVAQHLGGEFALGVETLRLFLEVDALEIKPLDTLRNFRIGLACDPAKRARSLALGQDFARIFFRYASDEGNRLCQVRNFCGNGESRVYIDGHREFAARPVVDDAALGRNFNGALLLVLGALFELAVLEDLQVDQAQADGKKPQQQNSAQEVEPELRTAAGRTRRHYSDPY